MFNSYCRLGLHVSASAREVIRATRRKFRGNARNAPQFREGRKSVYRAMLAEHRHARKLFQFVQSGGF